MRVPLMGPVVLDGSRMGVSGRLQVTDAAHGLRLKPDRYVWGP